MIVVGIHKIRLRPWRRWYHWKEVQVRLAGGSLSRHCENQCSMQMDSILIEGAMKTIYVNQGSAKQVMIFLIFVTDNLYRSHRTMFSYLHETINLWVGIAAKTVGKFLFIIYHRVRLKPVQFDELLSINSHYSLLHSHSPHRHGRNDLTFEGAQKVTWTGCGSPCQCNDDWFYELICELARCYLKNSEISMRSVKSSIQSENSTRCQVLSNSKTSKA